MSNFPVKALIYKSYIFHLYYEVGNRELPSILLMWVFLQNFYLLEIGDQEPSNQKVTINGDFHLAEVGICLFASDGQVLTMAIWR